MASVRFLCHHATWMNFNSFLVSGFVPRLGYYNSGLFYWLIEYFKSRGMEQYVQPALRSQLPPTQFFSPG